MRLKQNVNGLINWGFWKECQCVTPTFIQTRNGNWILQLGYVSHTHTTSHNFILPTSWKRSFPIYEWCGAKSANHSFVEFKIV